VLGSDPLAAQEAAPMRVRFVRREAAMPLVPARQIVRLEWENRADEPRWIVTTLSRETRIPEKDRFTSDAELPFFALKATSEKSHAVLLGFFGEPRFTAIHLPAKGKAVIDEFELPATENLQEMDWAEAKSLDVVLSDKKSHPIEKWLPIALTSSSEVRIPAKSEWKEILRDPETGAPWPNLPKDKVAAVTLDVIRRGRLTMEGYETPARFYHAAERPKAEAENGWRLTARFKPAQPLKVDELDFTPDGSSLIVSLQTFKVLALDLTSGKEKLYAGSEKARARFFAFSPDSHLLVKQATPDNLLAVNDWTSGKEVDLLREATSDTIANRDHVASPDGQRVMIALRDVLRLWDFAKFDTVLKLARAPEKAPFSYRCGVFSADGKWFAAGFENTQLGGRILVWDLSSPVKDGEALAPSKVLDNRQAGILFLAISADGKCLAATGKQAATIWVWRFDRQDDPDAWQRPEKLQHQSGFGNYFGLALTPDGKTVAVSSTRMTSDVFKGLEIPHGLALRAPLDARIPSQKTTLLTGLTPPVHAAAFSRDGRRFAAGDHEGTIQVWQRE
jgi:hypothetical protein